MKSGISASVANDTGRRQFVTFRIQSKRYGVPIESVSEMTQIGALYPISGAPSWILGMMQLRNSVVPILDLRIRLGVTRLADEIEALNCQLLKHRDEHLEWIDAVAPELDRRAASGAERGSRRCRLQDELLSDGAFCHDGSGPHERLRAPDERLHAAVEACRERAARGDLEGANRLLERARATELKELLQGIDAGLRELRARSRQMVVILRGAKEDLAVAVDHIDSVASVDAEQIVPRPLHALESRDESPDLLVASVVRRHDASDLVQILDVERMFRSAGVGLAVCSEPRSTADPASSTVGRNERFA